MKANVLAPNTIYSTCVINTSSVLKKGALLFQIEITLLYEYIQLLTTTMSSYRKLCRYINIFLLHPILFVACSLKWWLFLGYRMLMYTNALISIEMHQNLLLLL